MGLPSNFHSLPSRTEAMPPQRQKHISQNVATCLTSPAEEAASDVPACQASPPAAAAPKVPAEMLRKRLLDN